MSLNATASRVDVVVVGAGQAGLAVSYYLRAFGVEHVVLERGKVGESWRSARWDSFTLVTPNWMNRLPGYELVPGAAREFLPRDEVVRLLDGFARGLPVHAGTEVLSVEAGDSGYDLMTTTGRMVARAVVMAGGGQRRPVIPGLASAVPADIHQSDAGHYRNPDALPPGAVLVVGSGQSGMQIATDLAGAGREVLLATSHVPRVPWHMLAASPPSRACTWPATRGCRTGVRACSTV
jgi:putative flavoprotein involved in K+ transport